MNDRWCPGQIKGREESPILGSPCLSLYVYLSSWPGAPAPGLSRAGDRRTPGTGLKSWGTRCGVHLPHSSGKSSGVLSSLSFVGLLTRGEVCGENLS